MVSLDQLDEAALVKILTEPKNAITKQYTKLFDIDGVKLTFTEDAVKAVAKKAQKKVIGVEIVEEAVDAARVNAELNGLDNCEFIAGDVLRVIDDIEDKPDFIVLDPPRDGINPKALLKIINYGVKELVYISCKPTSLARDLVTLQEHGYFVTKACAVDQFPGTVHVECVTLLQRKNT